MPSAFAPGLVARSSDGKELYLGKKGRGGVSEQDCISVTVERHSRVTVDLLAFTEKSPDGCAPVWCSTHTCPWLLCDMPGAPGHETRTQGAHAVPPRFCKDMLPTLLL